MYIPSFKKGVYFMAIPFFFLLTKKNEKLCFLLSQPIEKVAVFVCSFVCNTITEVGVSALHR